MTNRIYRVYADYGPKGSQPENLMLDYDPSLEYSPSETLDAKISEVWVDLTASNQRLHDGKLLNLIGVSKSGYSIHLGATSFREYFALWSSICDGLSRHSIQLTEEEREFVHQNINPLSSYMAVVTDDKLVLGLKDIGAAEWLSFPGSGYLDVEIDTTDNGELRSTDRILRRELNEELNITNETLSIRCVGVFSERSGDFYLNPAIFSITKVECSVSDILEGTRGAEHNWEFKKVFTIPIRKDLLEKLIKNQLQELGSILPEPISTGEKTLAPKSPLMLSLIGRQRFGEDWYQTVISESNIRIMRA